MAVQRKTLDQLQHLETLYRRGYQSEVVDRSLDKIIELERAAARRELEDLEQRLRAFEDHYEMSSEEFYQRFRAGELGDSADLVEWSVFYEMWESVQDRLGIFEAEAD